MLMPELPVINSRFAVAVHLLALLTFNRKQHPGVPITSENASESVNTNPVVIRRILGSLRNAGMVSSQPGPNGGWTLSREPDTISLREVYCAVEDEGLFSLHHSPPNAKCLIGRNIQGALHGFFHDAESAMLERLGQKSVADVLDAVAAGTYHRAV